MPNTALNYSIVCWRPRTVIRRVVNPALVVHGWRVVPNAGGGTQYAMIERTPVGLSLPYRITASRIIFY